MARDKQKKKGGADGNGWLVTFSDLMTLLLTFFVLLLSMSSMDRSFLTRISMFAKDVSFMTVRGAGRLPTRERFVVELVEDPFEAIQQQDRLKDLLFPDDVLPEEIDRATLDENLQILERDDGVALVLSDKLLFEVGQSELNPAAAKLLSRIGYVLAYATAPVVVSGHSDATGGRTAVNYDLSAERALAVLGVLMENGLDSRRTSVSAYGPDRPVEEGTSREANASNRRVEILLKNKPDTGVYS